MKHNKLSINQKLESIFDDIEIEDQDGIGIDEAIVRIKELVRESLPLKKEIGEFRYGGCNPDYDRGRNDTIDYMRKEWE